jgi:hypothetical protein
VKRGFGAGGTTVSSSEDWAAAPAVTSNAARATIGQERMFKG